jgi:ubiquinone/menaquinone biosynthesis C-methylase UbiE
MILNNWKFSFLSLDSEVKRVLKPGGFYLFVEHVAAKGIELNSLIHRQERKLYPLLEWEIF